MTRLLVFTPTYGDGPQPETPASVAAQRFDGDLVHEVSWHNPYPGADMRNVTAQYQRARELALTGGYDGLLTVEHDMRLPDGAVQQLWDTAAPVVYATYLLRHGRNKVLNLWQWTGGRNIGMTLSLYPRELATLRRQGCGRVAGVGFGCTLIRREVLAAIPFRADPDGGAGDLPFAADCLRARVTAVGRFDVVCDHYHEGVWLRAFEKGVGIVVRVLALQDVTAGTENGPLVMRRGRYYSVSETDGTELARAGYVKVQSQATRETADAPPPTETGDAGPQKRRRSPSPEPPATDAASETDDDETDETEPNAAA